MLYHFSSLQYYRGSKFTIIIFDTHFTLLLQHHILLYTQYCTVCGQSKVIWLLSSYGNIIIHDIVSSNTLLLSLKHGLIFLITLLLVKITKINLVEEQLYTSEKAGLKSPELRQNRRITSTYICAYKLICANK